LGRNDRVTGNGETSHRIKRDDQGDHSRCGPHTIERRRRALPAAVLQGRFDYSFHGRRKTISFGTYPDTSLSLARKKADEARQQVRHDLDPSETTTNGSQEMRSKRRTGTPADRERRCMTNGVSRNRVG